MKSHINLPWGGTFELERKPLETAKFYTLCGIAAGALFVTLILGCVALR